MVVDSSFMSTDSGPIKKLSANHPGSDQNSPSVGRALPALAHREPRASGSHRGPWGEIMCLFQKNLVAFTASIQLSLIITALSLGVRRGLFPSSGRSVDRKALWLGMQGIGVFRIAVCPRDLQRPSPSSLDRHHGIAQMWMKSLHSTKHVPNMFRTLTSQIRLSRHSLWAKQFVKTIYMCSDQSSQHLQHSLLFTIPFYRLGD